MPVTDYAADAGGGSACRRDGDVVLFGGTQPQFKLYDRRHRIRLRGRYRIARDTRLVRLELKIIRKFFPRRTAPRASTGRVGGGSKGLLGRLQSLGFWQSMLHDLVAGYSRIKGAVSHCRS